jgi:two-component system, NtrC family, response regulator HydG
MPTTSPSLPAPELVSMLERLPGCRILIDPQFRIVAANGAYRAHCSTTPGQTVVGRHCYDVSHGYDAPCDMKGEVCPRRSVDRSGSTERTVHVHQTSRGVEHIAVEIVPLDGPSGETTLYMEYMQPLEHANRGDGCVGRDPAFLHTLDLVKRVAPTETSVLLLGETGTGKEVMARAIHDLSARMGKPFVVVDCAGLTESLFESELFGHERGAFTGAVARKSGLVEEAQDGTLFIDEVGDVPLSLQVKLLRLLETGVFRRVGGTAVRQASFRLVAATHRDLQQMVRDGQFRSDLYYRISTFPITVPALRDRRGDIDALAHAMLARLGKQSPSGFTPDALDCLAEYEFPGNVRELRNIVERATLLAEGESIEPEHLPDVVLASGHRERAERAQGAAIASPLKLAEADVLRREVETHRGSRRELAQRLGISERTLYRKLGALTPT